MTVDEIRAEMNDINARADAKLNAALGLSGTAQAAALAEARHLTDRGLELGRLLLEWMEGRLATVVGRLTTMAREEEARQSEIFGRLAGLARRAAAEAGMAVPAFGGGTSGQSDGQVASSITASGTSASSGGVLPTLPAGPPVDPDQRHTDLAHLHPVVRGKVEAVISDLDEAGVPMRVFEAFRSPERQRKLFAQGRTRPGDIVTNADAWHSYHQYGLAVDMVIDKPGMNPWETAGDAAGFWITYHEIGRKHGLEPLSFEKPHVQLTGTKASRLLAGEYPEGGDASWRDNLTAAIARWPGTTPPLPGGERPPLAALARGTAAAGIDWAALPPVTASGPSGIFGGRPWRVDARGVYLDGSADPQRTPGTPLTTGRVVELYAEGIAAAAQRHGIAPELIVMTIATETGHLRDEDFSGPNSFRWEAHVTDYSAGPMQVLSATARDMNARFALGYDDKGNFPAFTKKPKTPSQLALYDGKVAADIGAAYIRHQSGKTLGNPILVAASYNAGSLKPSGTNGWGLIVHGDHLDRAARWFGDACSVLAAFGR